MSRAPQWEQTPGEAASESAAVHVPAPRRPSRQPGRPSQGARQQEVSDDGIGDLGRYIPLVEHLVRDVALRLPYSDVQADLFSAGQLGLIKASKSFDPSKGVPFGAWATTKIKGEITDELRRLDWVSRQRRDRIKNVEQARDELCRDLGRQPTLDEVAEACLMAVDEVLEADADDRRSEMHSLDSLREDGTFEAAAEGPTPEDKAVQDEQIRYLHAAIALLPEKQRCAIIGHFFEGKTFEEIGQDLSLHRSRVHQIVNETIPLMRDAITQSLDPAVSGIVARRRAKYATAVHHYATTGVMPA